jgi:hypothetical protein
LKKIALHTYDIIFYRSVCLSQDVPFVLRNSISTTLFVVVVDATAKYIINVGRPGETQKGIMNLYLVPTANNMGFCTQINTLLTTI